jgi:hypothetical protein
MEPLPLRGQVALPRAHSLQETYTQVKEIYELQGLKFVFSLGNRVELRERNRLWSGTRHLLATHPFPLADYQLALLRPEPKWRVALARNPHLPGQIVNALMEDKSKLVNVSVAARTTLPPSAFQKLHRINNLSVDNVIASNVACPEGLLIELAASPHWTTRFQVARNPAAPAEARLMLAQDPNWEIRSVVVDHPKIEPEELEKILYSKSTKLIRRALQNPRLTNEYKAKLLHRDDLPLLLRREMRPNVAKGLHL